MGVLDAVIQMQNQGRSESEIINSLRSQGVPPRDIQDALSQASIKNAVEGEREGLQESIMNQEGEYIPTPPGQEYTPYPQEFSQNYPPEPQQQYPPQPYYPPSYPPQYPEYTQEPQAPQESYYQDYAPPVEQYEEYSQESNSNFIEIAEQVVSEKMKKIEKQIESVTEFKNLSENYLKILDERLKRLESTIDQLQISILDKIGSYGKNLSSVKKEMEMMQDSFSKVINPLLDRTSRR